MSRSQTRNAVLTGVALFVGTLFLIVYVDLPQFQLVPDETRQILYRYVKILATGGGFGYNWFQAASFTPSPLEIVILRLSLAFFPGTSFADIMLHIILLALCSTAIFFYLRVENVSVLISLTASITFLIAVPALSELYGSLYTILTLSLLVLICVRKEFTWAAGLFSGLALFTSPEALVLTILVIFIVKRPRSFIYGLVVVVVPCLILAVLWRLPLLPLVPLASNQPPLDFFSSLLAQANLIVVFLLLFLFGWARSQSSNTPVLLSLVTLDFLFNWLILNRPDYLGLWIALILVSAFGYTVLLEKVGSERRKWALLLVIAAAELITALQIQTGSAASTPTPILRATGKLANWINTETANNATVGLTRLDGLVGTVDRPIIDLTGRLDTSSRDALVRGDVESNILRTMPDYVIEDKAHLDKLPVWFSNVYRDAGTDLPDLAQSDDVIFKRLAAVEPFTNSVPVNYQFGDSLTLVGYGLDHTALRSGEPTRLKLDWSSRPMLAPYSIEVSLLVPPSTTYGKSMLRIEPTSWSTEQFSTYLLLVPDNDLSSSGIALAVVVAYPNTRPLNLIATVKSAK